MERLPNQRYTKEFKEEAVKMAITEKITQKEAAKRLQIPKETLHGWINKYRATGDITSSGKVSAPGDLQAENTRLRRELAEAKMERDILKKATAYFAKESR